MKLIVGERYKLKYFYNGKITEWDYIVEVISLNKKTVEYKFYNLDMSPWCNGTIEEHRLSDLKDGHTVLQKITKLEKALA